jgi:hypothetical protein
MMLQLKRAHTLLHSQQMASIAPILIGCIDYLAYGTIFTRVMFRPKIKLNVLFPARKAVDACREVVNLGTDEFVSNPPFSKKSSRHFHFAKYFLAGTIELFKIILKFLNYFLTRKLHAKGFVF